MEYKKFSDLPSVSTVSSGVYLPAVDPTENLAADRNKKIRVADFFDTYQGFTQSGAGAVSRSLTSKLRDVISVKDFGAVGDGVTDDTTAIQAAIDAAKTNGNSVLFAPGEYRVNGQLELNSVNLIGPGVFRRESTAAEYGSEGATIHLTGTVSSPLKIVNGGGVLIEGLTFYWPNQVANATPIVYPPLLTCVDAPPNYSLADVTLRDCTVINAYDFLALYSAAHSMGDVRIESCRIFAIRYSFDIRNVIPEVVFITNCIFSPGVWQNQAVFGNGGFIKNWHAQNGEWMHVDIGSGTIDGWLVSNSFVFGPRYGIRVISGGFFALCLSNTSFDATATSLSISGNSVMYGCSVVGGIHYLYRNDGNTAEHTGIDINTTGDVQISWSGVAFQYCSGSLMSVQGSGPSAISVSGGSIRNWGILSPGSDRYGLYVNAANVTVDWSPGCMVGGVVPTNIAVRVTQVKQLYVNGLHVNCKSSLITDAGLNSGNIRFNAITSGTSSAATISHGGSDAVLTTVQQAALDKPTEVLWPHSTRNHGTQTFGGGVTTALFATAVTEYCVNYNSGVFTVLKSGLYQISCMMSHDNSNVTSDQFSLTARIERGGSGLIEFSSFKILPTQVGNLSVSGSYFLLEGDNIRINVTRVSGSGNLVSLNNAAANNVSILCIS